MVSKNLLVLRNRTTLEKTKQFFSFNNTDAFYQEISISENININLASTNADIVLVTSQNALNALKNNLIWLKSKKIYCLNSDISSKVNLENLVELNWQNTKQLAKYIIKNEKPNQKIIHLCADNANKNFYKSLEEQGFNIKPINVYSTKFVNDFSANIINALKEEQIKYIMIFSQESLKAALSVINKYNLNINNYKLICFSKNIAAKISDKYSKNSTLEEMLEIYNNLKENSNG